MEAPYRVEVHYEDQVSYIELDKREVDQWIEDKAAFAGCNVEDFVSNPVTRVYRGEERIGLIYFDDGARPAPYDFVPTLTAADQYPRLRGIIMGGSVEQLVSRVEAAM